MAVIELNKDNFEKTIDDNNIVIIDFWAPWCGPCKQFAPVYEEMSNTIEEVMFAKVNTEEEQTLSTQFQIRSIPALMIFKEQIAIFSQSGALAANDLDNILAKAKAIDMDKVRAETANNK